MKEKSPTSQEALIQAAIDYRTSMANLLDNSIHLMETMLIGAELNTTQLLKDDEKLKNDPLMMDRYACNMLMKKARIHAKAMQTANITKNIHSLGVHARALILCSGQVHSIIKQNIASISGDKSALKQRFQDLYNDYCTVQGKFTRDFVKDWKEDKDMSIVGVDDVQDFYDMLPSSYRKYSDLDKVKDLEYGNNWYNFLTKNFCHTNIHSLKDTLLYNGGVQNSVLWNDDYALAYIMDYVVHNSILIPCDILLLFEKNDDTFLLNTSMKLMNKYQTEVKKHKNNCIKEKEKAFQRIISPLKGDKSKPQSYVEAMKWLKTKIIRITEQLSNICSIYQELDHPTNKLSNNDDERLFHMRKVTYHIHAVVHQITSENNLHVIGPDIRAAFEQLKEIRSKSPSDLQTISITEMDIPKNLKDLLSTITHPSLQSLILPSHCGGLGSRDNVLHNYVLFTMLSILFSNLCIAMVCLTNIDKFANDNTISSIKNVLDDFLSHINELEPQDIAKYFKDTS